MMGDTVSQHSAYGDSLLCERAPCHLSNSPPWWPGAWLCCAQVVWLPYPSVVMMVDIVVSPAPAWHTVMPASQNPAASSIMLLVIFAFSFKISGRMLPWLSELGEFRFRNLGDFASLTFLSL